MITKAQAGALQLAYIAGFPARIEQMITAAASSGVTSLVVSYIPASDAQALAFKATLEGAPNLWTVVQDTVNKTLTIS